MFSDDEIDHRFGFHKATIEGPEATLPRHSQLRRAYKAFAKELNEVLPDGRAKEVAFTELENASMWSHKAVAELAPAIEDPAPVKMDPDTRGPRQKLLAQFEHYRRVGEMDRLFISRLVREGVVTIEEYQEAFPEFSSIE